MEDWDRLEKDFDSTGMKEHIKNQGKSLILTFKNESKKVEKIARIVESCNNFVFSGCGDKYVVSRISEFLWDQISDKPLKVIQSRILADHPPRFLDSDTCVVFLSQSGTTADTVDACKTIMEKGCTVVVITNLKENKKGSLNYICEKYEKGYVLHTHTVLYPETPLPSTGSFHTSLALLDLLTLHINHEQERFLDILLNEIPVAVHELSNSEYVLRWAKLTADKLRFFNHFYVIGDGIRYFVAKKHANIMLMEGVKVNACSVESEEFIHSLIETLECEKKNPLILLKPVFSWYSSMSWMNQRIIRHMWLNYAGENMYFEINPFDFLKTKKKFSGIEGNLLSPFLYTVPLEWQAYYLALLKNVDPGTAKLVNKIRSKDELEKLLK